MDKVERVGLAVCNEGSTLPPVVHFSTVGGEIAFTVHSTCYIVWDDTESFEVEYFSVAVRGCCRRSSNEDFQRKRYQILALPFSGGGHRTLADGANGPGQRLEQRRFPSRMRMVTLVYHGGP